MEGPYEQAGQSGWMNNLRPMQSNEETEQLWSFYEIEKFEPLLPDHGSGVAFMLRVWPKPPCANIFFHGGGANAK
jgi:hypothetical protein